MSKKILMVASENDALPGGKVGGIGDVIRDLPKALTDLDWEVDIVVPSYGFLARLNNLEQVAQFSLIFSGQNHELVLYRAVGQNRITHYVLDHPAFSPQGERIYCNDPEGRPFATDASKFALFCQAVLHGIKDGIFDWPMYLHCHDWHTAFLLILLEFAEAFKSLKSITTLFTIHNLALQGVRPFKGDSSSLESWYPDLSYDGRVVADPDNPHCVNPMRAAIVLANKVHTVSPSYAQEIQSPSDHQKGIYGGERLQNDIRVRAEEQALHGILNGCEYPANVYYPRPSQKKIFELALRENIVWAGRERHLRTAHWLAEKRIAEIIRKKPGFVVTSIGRLTEQKVRLLRLRTAKGKTALESLLDLMCQQSQKIQSEPVRQGVFILLGSGSDEFENFFTEVSSRYKNFIFLNGYSDQLSQLLYSYGDLFLMPSSFEPCGISQMLAMRAGQPCLVNGVGGLKDTVVDNKNGFVFTGDDSDQQARAMLQKFEFAMNLFLSEKTTWDGICQAAAASRFTWKKSAELYSQLLYTPRDPHC